MEDGIGSGGVWPSDLLHCDDNNLVIMFLMWLLYVIGMMMVIVMMMITKKTIVMMITFLMLIQWSSVEQHPGCLCPNTKRCWKSRVLKTFEWQTDFQSRPLPRYPESRASFSSGKIKDFKNWKRITILNTSDIASLWFLAILSWRLWTLCCLWGFEKHVCHCLKCNIWFQSHGSQLLPQDMGTLLVDYLNSSWTMRAELAVQLIR